MTYNIVGFGFGIAYIVEGDYPDSMLISNGLAVDRTKLRLNYVDLEVEAGDILNQIRSQPDPRVLMDRDITPDQLRNMYPLYRDHPIPDFSLEESLAHTYRSDDPANIARNREKIEEYDRTRAMSDIELYNELLRELHETPTYKPDPVSGLHTDSWIASSIASFVIDNLPCPTLEIALRTLHEAWEDILRAPEKKAIYAELTDPDFNHHNLIRGWLRQANERVS
tara:strand:+ start:2809 stop:3480 length:672 start_codon:yes stop_codon:yes gene_type:complete